MNSVVKLDGQLGKAKRATRTSKLGFLETLRPYDPGLQLAHMNL